MRDMLQMLDDLTLSFEAVSSLLNRMPHESHRVLATAGEIMTTSLHASASFEAITTGIISYSGPVLLPMRSSTIHHKKIPMRAPCLRLI